MLAACGLAENTMAFLSLFETSHQMVYTLQYVCFCVSFSKCGIVVELFEAINLLFSSTLNYYDV